MNKSELVYDQKQLIADLIGCECFGIKENEDIVLSEYDEDINEINCMIQHFIDLGNEKEISEWRKMLQQTKVEKRRAKKLIDNKNRMEIAYS